MIPIYEEDGIEMNNKRKSMEVNLQACMNFAQFYKDLRIVNNKNCCEIAQAVFNNFFQIPRKEFLYALVDFWETDDGVKRKLLRKQGIIELFYHRSELTGWFHGNLIYNSGGLYGVFILFLRILHYIKVKHTVVPY